MTSSTQRSPVLGLLLVGGGLVAGYLLANALPESGLGTTGRTEGAEATGGAGSRGQRSSAGMRVSPRRAAPDEMMEELGPRHPEALAARFEEVLHAFLIGTGEVDARGSGNG